jgi:hypothetical protein
VADVVELPPVNVEATAPVIDPPWRLDPLQNIINVSWDDGIAVHFEFEWYGIEGKSHWFEEVPGR